MRLSIPSSTQTLELMNCRSEAVVLGWFEMVVIAVYEDFIVKVQRLLKILAFPGFVTKRVHDIIHPRRTKVNVFERLLFHISNNDTIRFLLALIEWRDRSSAVPLGPLLHIAQKALNQRDRPMQSRWILSVGFGILFQQSSKKGSSSRQWGNRKSY